MAAGAISPSCSVGGLNQNQNESGNQDDGVEVVFGEIAIDPTGTFFLASDKENLIHGEIAQTTAHEIEAIRSPVRLAFGSGRLVFVTSKANGGTLYAYDLGNDKIVWQKPVSITTQWPLQHAPLLEVTEDQRHLVLVFISRISVLDTGTGSLIQEITFEDKIIDMDLLADGQTAVVTLNEHWNGSVPESSVTVVDLFTGLKQEIEVPNCASELVLSPDQGKAFLAPTSCNKDPVSVIDLVERKFVRNLPGFGTVARAPSGKEMVAFMNMHNLDESLFEEDEPIPAEQSQYRLMFIDVETLDFETIDLGDNLPRYAMTPDGEVLLVDSFWLFQDSRIRVLDIATRTLHPVAGPSVTLEDFVLTSDSERALLLYGGLYELLIKERVIQSIPLLFEPKNINITPDDQHLLLRESDCLLWVYNIENREVDHSIGL